MKIDIKTRIPLESGKVYYGCEGNDEYIYKPSPVFYFASHRDLQNVI